MGVQVLCSKRRPAQAGAWSVRIARSSLVLRARGARRVRIEAPREPCGRLEPRGRVGVGFGVGVGVGVGIRIRAGAGELDAPGDGVVREDEVELFDFVEELEGREAFCVRIRGSKYLIKKNG